MAIIKRASLAAAGLLAVSALGACAPSTPANGSAAPSPALALGIDTTGFDRGVRPQDDFFQFVNGGWLRRTQIPADRTSVGTFLLLRDSAQAALRTIIDSVAAAPNPPGSEGQKVGDLYRSFMDTASIERLGAQPVQPVLARVDALTAREQLPELFAQLARGLGEAELGRGSPDGGCQCDTGSCSDRTTPRAGHGAGGLWLA